jgi:hypothetical protein
LPSAQRREPVEDGPDLDAVLETQRLGYAPRSVVYLTIRSVDDATAAFLALS